MADSISLKDVKRKRKLFAAFANLKLSVFEAQRMCVIDDRIETAAWAFNLKDKTGKILIGSKILDTWSISEIEKAIEHEFLHFSVYSAFRSQYESLNTEMPEIFNITSDGAIWKGIFETGGNYTLPRLFKKIGVDEPDNPFLLVLNPQRSPDGWYSKKQWRKAEEMLGLEKVNKLKQIWKDVHEDLNVYKASIALRELAKQTSEEPDSNQGGGQKGSSTSESQNSSGGGTQPPEGQEDEQQKKPKTAKECAKEIMDTPKQDESLTAEFAVRRIPEGCEPDEDESDGEPDAMREALEQFIDANKKDFEYQIGRGGGFSDMFSKAFKTSKVSKKKVQTQSLKKFIERMKIKQTLEECSASIKSSMLPSVSRAQPFMYNLSRLGITYQSIGLSGKIIPLWWNKTPENAKPKLAIYVDTSGSMDTFKSETVFLIGDLISDIPSKIFWFSGSVGEMSAREFAAGKYSGGGCTSFNSVVEHFMKLREYNDCIIITDGESSVSDDNAKKVKRMRKTVYACYMVDKSARWYGSDYTTSLNNVAKASFKVFKNKKS